MVLTVDYATTPDRVDEAYRRSRKRVYVPFVPTLDLDRLTINAGPLTRITQPRCGYLRLLGATKLDTPADRD